MIPFLAPFLALPLARTIAAVAISFPLGAGVGYLYHAHKTQLRDAQREAAQTAANNTAGTIMRSYDAQSSASLQREVDSLRSRSRALMEVIDEYRRQSQNTPNPTNTPNPNTPGQNTPPSLECRLPDGLRTHINAEFAPDFGVSAGAVPGEGR